MASEFSFPPEKAKKVATDIAECGNKLGILGDKLLQVVDKASGSWDGNIATAFLGELRKELSENIQRPKQIAVDLCGRLGVTTDNYIAADNLADDMLTTLLKAFD